MSPRIRREEISVVIPVRNDEARLLRLVSALAGLARRPREIIVVDNGSERSLERPESPLRRWNVIIERCEQPGPAAARNVGWRRATGEWVLFTDSDCVPAPDFVGGYERTATAAIAFAGAVEALGHDVFSRYYETQNILVPPEDAERCPRYLVTANCLVSRSALVAIDGFDESFPIAGGEDIDLGVRLRALGRVEFNLASRVRHDFEDSLRSFVRRFLRYGYGNGLVARKLAIDLRPEFFSSCDRSLTARVLSLIQFFTMMYGYELALRGVPFGGTGTAPVQLRRSGVLTSSSAHTPPTRFGAGARVGSA